MKKLLALILVAVMLFALASCVNDKPDANQGNQGGNGSGEVTPGEETPGEETPGEETPGENDGPTLTTPMTYEEYNNAAIDDEVLVDFYVQATQSWWDNKITVYGADDYGAYFVYEMACSEEDAAKLLPGTLIRVSGYKAEWSGEVEIVDATFEFLESEEPVVYDPTDLTDLLGTDELITYQNWLAIFEGMTVEAIEFKGGEPGDDIYVTLSLDGNNYSFCVERYLTGPETELYQQVSALEIGALIDVTAFVYWYEGPNPHIVAIQDHVDSGVMSYDEYVEAELDSEVLVDLYVQATQSWWDNKITVYGADDDGAYFVYEMECSEEDAAKLLPGTLIRVSGYKAEWSGEVEIVDATFEFLESDFDIVYDPIDLTDLLGTEELIEYQNQLATFMGMTVVAVEFKGGTPGDDIYVTLSLDGNNYSFCVERYLTGPDTELYQAVSALEVGDVINVTGFVYWYEGPNPHITAIELV